MIKASYRRYTATSAQADSKTPLICVGRHISLGVQRASADLGYSHGVQSVSFVRRNCNVDILFCVATEQREDDPMAIDADDVETWSGNRRRRLWKSTCVRAALNVRFSL